MPASKWSFAWILLTGVLLSASAAVAREDKATPADAVLLSEPDVSITGGSAADSAIAAAPNLHDEVVRILNA